MSQARREEPPPPASTSQRASQPPARKPEVPDEVRAFRQEAERLPDRPGDPSHAPLVSAMRSMASALSALPASSSVPSQTARQIQIDADKLELSPATSLRHADLVRRALDRAVQALEQLEERTPGATTARTDAAAAQVWVAQVDPTQPLLPQRPRVDRAFQAVAKALTSAAELTFPARAEARPAGGHRADLAVELQALRRMTTELSTSRGTVAAQLRIKLLRGMADAFEGLGVQTRRMSKALAAIRSEADRLDEAAVDIWGRAEHLQAALAASVRALDEAWRQRGKATDRGRPWLKAAREAIGAVKTDQFVDFQRAPVQDAFRSLIDTLAAYHEPLCPGL